MALLMVVWVLTILMVTVLSFSFLVRSEAHSTLAFKEDIEKKFLAEAGVERAITELLYRRQNRLSGDTTDVWKIDGTPYRIEMAGGYYTVRITDESGKLDINTVPEVVLKNLLLNHGVKDDEADGIVDCIMDWKDPDDLVRLHGAESDYYMSLPNPYKAKNGDFDTLEELLLVKGITPELLYGTGEKKGIIDFLTVSARNTQVNLNSAPKEVLMAVPGMTPEIAEGIIDYRKDHEIKGIQEVQFILKDGYGAMAPYISAADSNVFSIDAVGGKGSGKGGYAIKATVALDLHSKYRYLYYSSPAVLPQ